MECMGSSLRLVCILSVFLQVRLYAFILLPIAIIEDSGDGVVDSSGSSGESDDEGSDDPPHTKNVTEVTSNVPQLSKTIKEVTLVLKGNFNEVIGEDEESKQQFLSACTLKLSKDNARDVRCVDVRPGSIIVDIEGAPKQLGELAEELKTEKSFVLEGYAELTIDKVDVISVPTSTESLPEEIEEDGPPIIKYLMANGGVFLFTNALLICI